jgi:hypothetical protein
MLRLRDEAETFKSSLDSDSLRFEQGPNSTSPPPMFPPNLSLSAFDTENLSRAAAFSSSSAASCTLGVDDVSDEVPNFNRSA